MRYKLLIEYDGTNFVGWQRQNNGVSIQGCIEDAIEKFCQIRTSVTAAGRTDAGVHARGMAAHFDSERELDVHKIADAINFYLRPNPITILSAELAGDDFHARFSAHERAYIYRIANRRPPLAIDRNRAWQIPMPLNAAAMHIAAQQLIGTFDFTSFRDAQCQAKSPVKTIHEIRVTSPDPPFPTPHSREIEIFVRAPSFLHHMVRNITGSLVEVGLGKWIIDDFIRVRDARDRSQAGVTAPAHGLYFLWARY